MFHYFLNEISSCDCGYSSSNILYHSELSLGKQFSIVFLRVSPEDSHLYISVQNSLCCLHEHLVLHRFAALASDEFYYNLGSWWF